jgi:glutamyl/glutaminyl-tRNA synthetase
MSDEKFLNFVKPFIKADLSFTDLPDLVLLTFKKQIYNASMLNELIEETFIKIDRTKIDSILESNQISKQDYGKCISSFKNILSSYHEINETNTDEIIKKVKEETGLKGKALFMPIRLFAIGKEHGPEMNKILPIIGKKNLLAH